MNYYERYCGDYQRDTAHLSLAEHGAYTMLLDTYFSVEKPLPPDLSSLYRVCRAMTRLEQQAVKTVAEQFFPVSEADGLRHNQRADREIARARPKIEAARNNGRKGGRPAKTAVPLQAEQKSAAIPAGFPPGSANPFPDAFPGISLLEPDGKPLQPQPHHQPQLQSRITCTERAGKHAEGEDGMHGIGTHAERQFEPRTAGACCQSLRQLGIQDCNSHHPVFLALLRAGAMEEEFSQAAMNAIARGKASFAYVIGTVRRQREEAAKLALHRGRMPNRQEQLESTNSLAADSWLPPELREGGNGMEPGKANDANG